MSTTLAAEFGKITARDACLPAITALLWHKFLTFRMSWTLTPAEFRKITACDACLPAIAALLWHKFLTFRVSRTLAPAEFRKITACDARFPAIAFLGAGLDDEIARNKHPKRPERH